LCDTCIKIEEIQSKCVVTCWKVKLDLSLTSGSPEG